MKTKEFFQKRNFNNDVEVPTGPVEVSTTTEVVKKVKFATKAEIMAVRTAELERVVDELSTVIWECVTAEVMNGQVKFNFDVCYTREKTTLLMCRTTPEEGGMKKFLNKCKEFIKKEEEDPSKEELMDKVSAIFNSFQGSYFEQAELLKKVTENLCEKEAYVKCTGSYLRVEV